MHGFDFNQAFLGKTIFSIFLKIELGLDIAKTCCIKSIHEDMFLCFGVILYTDKRIDTQTKKWLRKTKSQKIFLLETIMKKFPKTYGTLAQVTKLGMTYCRQILTYHKPSAVIQNILVCLNMFYTWF